MHDLRHNANLHALRGEYGDAGWMEYIIVYVCRGFGSRPIHLILLHSALEIFDVLHMGIFQRCLAAADDDAP